MNRRTDVAHTEVSILGKMFMTIFLPEKALKPTSDMSVLVSVKSGAFEPGSGRSPAVDMILPFKRIFAMCAPYCENTLIRNSPNPQGG